jgi:hypothetical protein
MKPNIKGIRTEASNPPWTHPITYNKDGLGNTTCKIQIDMNFLRRLHN